MIGFGGNSYIVLMVVGPLLGVVGTLAGQFVSATMARRTTSGTVETSNATELWTENARLIERLTKEVDRLAADLDHVREELRRMRGERDDALKDASAMRERVHELELELQRLKFGQAAAAVTTVKVETGPAAAPPPVETGGTDAGVH